MTSPVHPAHEASIMTPTPNANVLMAQDGAVLIITINRPEVRNAIDRQTSEMIAQAMDELDNNPHLSIGILTGQGEHFCSGMDLKAFLKGERVELEGRGLAGIAQTPPRKPLIAAVEGYALAGGCEIALACDLIVASDTAQFGIPEVRRGLIAGSGGLMRLSQRIPPQIALEYALTGQPMSAVDAAHWGLVNRLTAPGHALAQAKALALEISRNGPLAVQMTKHIMSQSSSWPEDQKWAKQNEILERVIASNDAREGALAFSEKRAPKWTGH
jgi:enoyl-CoA hydratase